MKQTDKNIYRLKLKCEKCNKDIFVCFDILIKEIPDYGPEETYKPKKIPKYLRHLIRPSENYQDGDMLMNTSTGNINLNSMNSSGSVNNESRYLVLCKRCEQIENISK